MTCDVWAWKDTHLSAWARLWTQDTVRVPLTTINHKMCVVLESNLWLAELQQVPVQTVGMYLHTLTTTDVKYKLRFTVPVFDDLPNEINRPPLSFMMLPSRPCQPLSPISIVGLVQNCSWKRTPSPWTINPKSCVCARIQPLGKVVCRVHKIKRKVTTELKQF